MAGFRQKMLQGLGEPSGKDSLREDGQMVTDYGELQCCYEQIQRLIAENQELRRASECFGALAERLNRQLVAERNRTVMSEPCGTN
jgi:hypothetical protein